jgi:hypothetical protein
VLEKVADARAFVCMLRRVIIEFGPRSVIVDD